MVHAFDFDGARAGLAVKGCVNPAVHAEVAAPAAPAAFPLPDCPVEIAAKTGSVTKRGVTSVRLGCPAGCRATDLRAIRPFRASLFGGRIRAGETRTVRFRLPPKVLSRVLAGRTVRVRMVASTAGYLYQVPARQSRFEQVVTVAAGG
jgi:hypothetical protein